MIVTGRFDHLWAPPDGAGAAGARATSADPAPAAPSGSVPSAAAPSVAVPIVTSMQGVGTATMLPPIQDGDDEGDATGFGDLEAPTPVPHVSASDETRRIRPAAARAAAADTFEVELSTGERLALDAPVVIGRAPQAAPGVLLLQAPAHLVDLSRSHLALEPTQHGAFALDLGSGNGSVLLRDGARIPLAPHERTAIGPDDTVVLADVLAVRIGRRS